MRVAAPLALLLLLSLDYSGVHGSGSKRGGGFQLIHIGGSPSPAQQYYTYYPHYHGGCYNCHGGRSYDSNDQLYARKKELYDRMIELYHDYQDCASDGNSDCRSQRRSYMRARRQYLYISDQPYSSYHSHHAEPAYYPAVHSVGTVAPQRQNRLLYISNGGGKRSGKKNRGRTRFLSINGEGGGNVISDDDNFINY